MSKVTISQGTMEVLKNFVSINSSILIREGNQLKTISLGENAIAQYTCDEVFPQTFGIYDLNQFLVGLSLFEEPVLEFENSDYVTIRSAGRSAKYYFSNPEITLKAAPEKDVKFPGSDIEFTINREDISTILKASAVYKIVDLKIHSDEDGTVTVSLVDKENETSTVFSIQLDGESTGEYDFYMKVENIRLLGGDYQVKVSKHLITEWQHKNFDLKYYIALEP